MRITLVASHPYPSPQALPLANAFLKSYLATIPTLNDQVTVTLCDLFTGEPPADGVAAILATRPDVVGISLYLWNRGQAGEIVRDLRRERPGIPLFAGGPEATADPSGVLADAPYDFLIVGEGETTFAAVVARLLAGQSTADLPGVALLQKGELRLLPGHSIEDLDLIPSPFLNGIIDPAAYPGILWQLSRGCTFACDYCFDAKDGRGVRRFSLQRVEAELTWFARMGIAQVFVLDSTFNQDLRRAKAILRLIKRHAPHIHFHFEVRSEFIDRELARLFAQITCSLQIGLQSADPLVLKGVKRAFNRDDFIERVGLLNETGAIFGFDLIYGLPQDTLQGFAASLDFAIELYPNHLDIFPLAVLPGTPLAARSAELGLRHLCAPPYTLLESPTFAADEMARAEELATACDIFYSRGKAVSWFNAIIAPLGLTPSGFFASFRSWLAAARGEHIRHTELSDPEIWQLQRAFLSELFALKDADRFLPIALDLVDYHYHYAAALMAVPPELPTDRELGQLPLLEVPWQVSSATQLASFNYEIFDLLEAGEPDLPAFADCFSPSGSWAAIYPRGDEVFTESIAEPYFNLLRQLDGSAPAGRIADTLEIPTAEAASFLEFAAAEGIVSLYPSS